MIDFCRRLIKKHPYLLLGIAGIALMAAPLAILANLNAMCEMSPLFSGALTPLFMSTQFVKMFGRVTLVGAVILMLAMFWAGCAWPPSRK